MSYWAKKNEMAAKAKKHAEEMERLYTTEIQECADLSNIYTNVVDVALTPNYPSTTIILEDAYSVDATRHHSTHKTCVLNFASHKNPGGMFLQGSTAQEESLCHASILYNVLSRMSGYYNTNKERLNRSLYTNRAIYTPDVTFIKDGGTFRADVLTCAAPNKTSAQKYCRVSDAENSSVLRDRIDFMLRVSAHNKPETLILGAYGCGVFGQNPTEVAEIFKELLKTRYDKVFKMVVFAIPDMNSDNYKAFREVLT